MVSYQHSRLSSFLCHDAVLKSSDIMSDNRGGTHEPERVEVMMQRVPNQAHHAARPTLFLPTVDLGQKLGPRVLERRRHICHTQSGKRFGQHLI